MTVTHQLPAVGAKVTQALYEAAHLIADGSISAAMLDAAYQPLDSDLTAIAALSTTAYGRAFLALADAAAARTALALGTAATSASTDFDATGAAASAQAAAATDATTKANAAQAAAIAASQPLDSDLTAIAALSTTSFGRGLLASADAAALRTSAALGTLATQSGTFSGTSSGTNTGDQTVPSFATSTVALGSAAAAGAATTVIRSDSTVAAFDATAPSTQAYGDAAAVGTAAFATRRDHKHAMPAAITDATITTTDITTNNVSTSKHGFAPKAPNVATQYLDGTGAYSTPAGTPTRPYLDSQTLNGTYGDDFTASSLDAKWTVKGTPTQTFQEANGSFLGLLTDATSSEGITQTANPIPDGEYQTVIRQFGPWTTGNGTGQMIGLVILDANGTGLAAFVYDSSALIYFAVVTTYAYASIVTSTGQVVAPWQSQGLPIWFAINKVGTAYKMRYSTDGTNWSPYTATTTLGGTGTPRYVGVLRVLGTKIIKVAIDWFNVV